MNPRRYLVASLLLAEGMAVVVACSSDDQTAPPGDTGLEAGGPPVGDGAPSDDASDGGQGAPLGPSCRLSGWCWENPTPRGEHLTGVWGSSPSDIWATSGAGALFHGDGTTWKNTASPTTSDLHGVWGTSATDVWTVGGHGSILHYDGAAWTSQDADDGGFQPDSLVAIHGTAHSDVWAVGDQAVLHYDGTSWTSRAPDGGLYFQSVFARAPDDAWIGTAIVASPSLLHWTGAGWIPESITVDDSGSPFVGSIGGLWGAPSGDLFAVGYDGIRSFGLRRSGTTWTAAPLTSDRFSGIYGTSASDVTAVGAGGAIAHYDGSSWTTTSAPVTPPGVALEAIGPAGSDTWIVGEGATFLRRTGAAVTWTPTSVSTAVSRKALNGVSVLSAEEAWAVGDTVLHRTAGGWAAENAQDDGGVLEDKGLHGVAAIAPNDVWAGGNAGAFHWDGAKWSENDGLTGGGTLTGIADLSAAGPNDVWAISAGVFHFTGSGWAPVPLIDTQGATITFPGLFTVVARAPNDVWCGGPFTVLHYDGAHWRKLNDTDAGPSLVGPASGIAPISFSDAWVVTGAGANPSVAYHWDGAAFTAFPIAGDWRDGLTFSKMAASSTTDAWVVANGGIGHWDGKSWSYSDRPISSPKGIAVAGGHAWVVGADGTILHHAP